MENQHRLIKGYRDLKKAEIDQMNEIKELAQQVGDLVERMAMYSEHDPRWLEIGKTDLQKGFMFLTRAIAQPEFF